uniref:Uncharacterized protein n=1 Tax=Peronospora matthiolae TaxID=2874970 RepID=A0AAV1UJU6_9STRA
MADSIVLDLTATSNPYLDYYHKFVREHPGELTAVFDPELSDEARSEMYAALDVRVAMRYSWAIPDERALQIIKHYGPIVEMGAGSGYWARLLQDRGVDVVAYDLHVDGDEEEESKESEKDGGKTAATSGEESHGEAEETMESDDGEQAEDEEQSGDEEERGGDQEDEDEDEEVEVEQVYWTKVVSGTPKDLRKHTDRTLFLCYPDDFEDSSESVAMASLCNYAGDTVIHVGELFGHTVCLPNAWGRTSSEEFQTHLATVYHKVLQVPLPSWHSSIDTLTVWKRTKSSIVEGAVYAYIPDNQRIDLTAASPSTRHLLLFGDASTDANATTIAPKKCTGEYIAESPGNGGESHQSDSDDSSIARGSTAKRVKR